MVVEKLAVHQVPGAMETGISMNLEEDGVAAGVVDMAEDMRSGMIDDMMIVGEVVVQMEAGDEIEAEVEHLQEEAEVLLGAVKVLPRGELRSSNGIANVRSVRLLKMSLLVPPLEETLDPRLEESLLPMITNEARLLWFVLRHSL
jgi:hypothetical protein